METIEEILKRIEKIEIRLKAVEQINPTDIIVYRYDKEKMGYKEAHDCYHTLIETLPNNQIIGIPMDADIDIMDWQRLYDYVMSIKPEGEVK